MSGTTLPKDGFNIGGAGPGKPSGAYTNSEHIGHLMAYVGPVEEERTSSFGDRKDKYTVAACSFVVCLSHKKAWSDTDVSGAALAPRLLTAMDEIVAVRLIEGEAKEGWNAPILPEDAIASELVEIQEVFARYGARLPSGRVIFDVVQYNADHAEAPPASPES
jgi:hypothetical protein